MTENTEPKSVSIEIELIQRPDGRLFIKKNGGTVAVKDTIDNIALLSFLEVELNFALLEAGKLNNPSVEGV
jgi:hypothetical protein